MVRERIEERTGLDGQKIIDHIIEGITFYPGPLGKKCDYCDCYFNSDYDEFLHLQAFGRHAHGESAREPDENSLEGLGWKPSDFDKGEYCAASKNMQLAQACKMKGSLKIGIYEYSVSKNGKWLKRKRNIAR
jgi:hypothetical protein